MILQNKITRENPFNRIYKECNSGTNFEKLHRPRPFPIVLDVELTNYCNFKCAMCPTGNKMVKREKGFISNALMDKIIFEAAQFKTAIRFVRWGEPLYHPRLLGFVKAIHGLSLLCHINTNGSLLDIDFIHEIIHIPLDSIKISVHMYSVEDMVKQLYLRRNFRKKPFIHVGTTKNELHGFEQVFRETFSPFADKVTISKTKDLKQQSDIIPDPCSEVFDKLSINWDGTVSACCADYDKKMLVGDLNKQTLKQIWDSDKLAEYRRSILNKEIDKLEICKRCMV